MPTKETVKKPSNHEIGLSEDTLMGLYSKSRLRPGSR